MKAVIWESLRPDQPKPDPKWKEEIHSALLVVGATTTSASVDDEETKIRTFVSRFPHLHWEPLINRYTYDWSKP